MAVVILTELHRPQRAPIAITGHVLHHNNWVISLIRHTGTEDAAGKELVSHVGKFSTLLSYQIDHHEQHTADRRTIREKVHIPRDRLCGPHPATGGDRSSTRASGDGDNGRGGRFETWTGRYPLGGS